MAASREPMALERRGQSAGRECQHADRSSEPHQRDPRSENPADDGHSGQDDLPVLADPFPECREKRRHAAHRRSQFGAERFTDGNRHAFERREQNRHVAFERVELRARDPGCRSRRIAQRLGGFTETIGSLRNEFGSTSRLACGEDGPQRSQLFTRTGIGQRVLQVGDDLSQRCERCRRHRVRERPVD